jgi:hypothetical protein
VLIASGYHGKKYIRIMATLIISQSYIIEQTFTSDRVDTALIKDNYIYITQLEVLKPAIGDTFYDALIAEVLAGSYTGLNETLVDDYIKPMLAFYVKARILPELRLRTTAKGVMINTSTTSDAASKEEVAALQDISKEMGDALLDEMRRYILDNSSSFPDYVTSEGETKIKANIIIPKR